MKKLALILIGSVFALNTFAQEGTTTKRTADATAIKEYKYCAEMKDGKLKVMNDENILNADVTLANGTRVTSDAMVIKRDGTKVNLKAGECVDMEGNIMDEKSNMKDNDMKKN